ncbi:hypothetical protein, partial [Intestinimonas sp. HCP28S3_D6]|uniref:hypothetical protein n=1 Tax=Intestinimonas sp. HCP28S3_D6 TaxID=3438942 RepID=UPI003F8A5E4F
IVIALPWKKLCANFILPCGENHYGFFLRCPTSFYNRPLFIGTAGVENKVRSQGIKKRTGFSAGPQKRGDIFLSVRDGNQPSTTSPVRT